MAKAKEVCKKDRYFEMVGNSEKKDEMFCSSSFFSYICSRMNQEIFI